MSNTNKILDSRLSGDLDQVGTGRARRERARAMRISDLTPSRSNILMYLFEERWALTRHINEQAQPGKLVQHTQRDLKWLGEMGFVQQFVARPEQGRASPYGWLLTRAGAVLLGQADQWDNHYLRQPTYYQLRLRENELALRAAVGKIIITLKAQTPRPVVMPSLMVPATFSKARPIPAQTEQFQPLYDAAAVREHIRATIDQANGKPDWEKRRDALAAGGNTLAVLRDGVPLQSNDYVVFVPNSKSSGAGQPNQSRQLEAEQVTAIVLVLCPPDASAVYLAGRFEQYAVLKKYQTRFHLGVVFEDELHVTKDLKKLADEAHWYITNLADLPDYLMKCWQNDMALIEDWKKALAQIKAKEEEEAARLLAVSRAAEEAARKKQEQELQARIEAEARRQAEARARFMAEIDAEIEAEDRAEAEAEAARQAAEQAKRGFWSRFKQ